MTQAMLEKETRTKEDRTPVQTVIQLLAFKTSESDGGNGFSIDPLKDEELIVSQPLLISITTKVATALMQHPNAKDDESHPADYIVRAWLKDVKFLRQRAVAKKPYGNIFAAFDALDEHHKANAHNDIFVDCHRRTCAAEYLVKHWENQKNFLNYLHS